MTHLPCRAVILAILLAAVAASGCGLKGPLVLPPKSDEVVIRAPAGGEAAPTEGPATTVPAPTEKTEKTPAPARPKDERIPPPPLPGGGAGT
jgi:predicted small lipoprotein YifL